MSKMRIFVINNSAVYFLDISNIIAKKLEHKFFNYGPESFEYIPVSSKNVQCSGPHVFAEVSETGDITFSGTLI